MKRLARRKSVDEAKPAALWMNTFADLMNLLLCFFVLLFAMSSVDEEKFNQIAASLSSSFSIFSGGQSSIGDGQLINMGVAQLNEFEQYFSNMGKTTEDTEGEEIEELKQFLTEANKVETDKMYDNISEMSTQYNLDNYLDIETDQTGGQYVLINISGSLLYDSGKAQLKSEAIPIFSKVGDILKTYKGYRISIIGHTDNVPVVSGVYRSNKELSAARAINAAEYLIDVKGINPANIEWIGRGEYDPIADNSTEAGRSKNRRIEIRIYNSLNTN